jgi:N-acetylneuraminate lyase
LSAGCDAGIGTTYNFLLPEIKGIYNAFKRGDIAKALELQTYVARVCEVFSGRSTIMVTKFIMSRLGYDVYYPIHPMRRLSEKEEREVILYLQNVGMKIE